MTTVTPAPPPAARRIPRGIWVLGCVSLLMDVSSEMIHGLLPVYLVTVLGASALTVGLIEGMAEATAAISKLFSGALSDWLRRRKWLTVLGYGLAAFTKPVFPLATSVGWVVAARFIDRLGKGIREAPRDALIADLTPPDLRGASFGLRQSLDTIGAFVGPLLAIALMWWTANRFTTVFWVAVIPAFAALALLVVAVKEPASSEASPSRLPLQRRELGRLGSAYWLLIAIGTLFTLARFSEVFLLLRANAVAVPPLLVPGVLVIMNIAYAASAYPLGAISDRMDRSHILGVGLIVLVGAHLVLAIVPGLAGLVTGTLLWGLHLGCTQGLLAALVADTAPKDLRGTAFGVFNLINGAALLAAGAVAGWVWDRVGFQATFFMGAGFAIVALLALAAARRRSAPTPGEWRP